MSGFETWLECQAQWCEFSYRRAYTSNRMVSRLSLEYSRAYLAALEHVKATGHVVRVEQGRTELIGFIA